MISQSKFNSLLFFDIETRGKYPSYEEFLSKDPLGAKIWEKKVERQYKDMTTSEAYLSKVSLYPEFGAITCLSYGICKDGEKKIITLADPDEKRTLLLIADLFRKAFTGNYVPTGWNVKAFDIPWIVRKMLIYGIPVPNAISTFEKKPWEINILDLKDLWKSFCTIDCNFEEAVYALGIDSPKDDIEGSQTHAEYWNGNIEKVKTYCEKDVHAMIQLVQHIIN